MLLKNPCNRNCTFETHELITCFQLSGKVLIVTLHLKSDFGGCKSPSLCWPKVFLINGVTDFAEIKPCCSGGINWPAITTPSMTLGFQVSFFLLLTIMSGDLHTSSVACHIARFEPFSYLVFVLTSRDNYKYGLYRDS